VTTRITLTKILTPRQIEVLALAAQGYSNPEIASRLRIRDWTIRQHLKETYVKLQARSRAHAVHLAHKAGLPEIVNAPTYPPDISRRTRLEPVAPVKPVALSAERRR
jgi:DNA-binding CsgD family transcriptional regulator